LAVVEAEGGQFGVEARAVLGAARARLFGGLGGEVESANPEDQAAEQAKAATAALPRAQGAGGLLYFFFA
jgi:hypothetical protein